MKKSPTLNNFLFCACMADINLMQEIKSKSRKTKLIKCRVAYAYLVIKYSTCDEHAGRSEYSLEEISSEINRSHAMILHYKKQFDIPFFKKHIDKAEKIYLEYFEGVSSKKEAYCKKFAQPLLESLKDANRNDFERIAIEYLMKIR